MGRSKNHNFSIGLNRSYKNIKNKNKEIVTIYLFYLYGTSAVKKSTGIKIPAIAYNQDTRRLKQSYEQNSAYNDMLLDIEKKIPEVRSKMIKGKMTYRSAFNELLNKTEDLSLSEYVEQTPKIKKPSKDKYHRYLKALNGHFTGLNRLEYTDLKFSVLDDANEVERIADIIKNQVPQLNHNSQIDYMNAIDTIYKKYKNLKGQDGVFRLGGYIDSKRDTNVQPIPFVDLAMGINKINTKQKYMSYLYWLYSFCLRGLDGQDIVNISEKDVKGDFDYNKHYYPDANLHTELKDFNKKAWYIRSRGKGSIARVILINVFPTLLIQRLLKEAIKSTHPQYSYKGSDKLRLFNFKTKRDDGSKDVEGDKKWKSFKDTMRKNFNLMFDGCLHRTRHTFTQTAVDELNVSHQKADEMLGHKTIKSSLKYYLSESQLNTDIYHIHTIQEFDVLKLLKALINFADNKRYLKRYELKGDLKGKIFKSDGNIENAYQVMSFKEELMFDIGTLTTWELDKEMKLQKLMRKVETRPNIVFENGVVKVSSHNDYSKDLNELLEQKQEYFENSKYFKSYIKELMESWD